MIIEKTNKQTTNPTPPKKPQLFCFRNLEENSWLYYPKEACPVTNMYAPFWHTSPYMQLHLVNRLPQLCLQRPHRRESQTLSLKHKYHSLKAGRHQLEQQKEKKKRTV